MAKTVKAHESKLITARELFSLSYGTRELYDEKTIENIKQRILDRSKMRVGGSVEFFENDGVIFYSSTFTEEGGPCNGMEMTVINYLKDYSILAGGELWKFGFINKKTGEIYLLFGGHYIAKGRKDAFHYFEIAKTVTANKFKNSADLIAFAHKE